MTFIKGKKYENIRNGLVYICVRVHENGTPYFSRRAHGVGSLGFTLEPENYSKFKACKPEKEGRAYV